MTRTLIFILSLCLIAPHSAWAIGLMETPAKQVYITDFDTGQVLFSKNAEERMPTSSMSKVLTMYLVFEALKEGKISLETELPVSEKAWRMGGSKMFVEVGKKAKVEDLIRGVIIQSGNDATIVLAEGLAGSEEAFARALNYKAKELGMTNSNFVNASGWPDENHYSTAKDLAILAKAIVTDFPDFYKYYSEETFEYSGIPQGNRNPLLYRDLGADGIKTGHTEGAGYGLMASGTKDGRRIIMVVNGLDSAQARGDESARLFSWALSNFENVKIFQKGQSVESAPVQFGKQDTVDLVAMKNIVMTLPKMTRDQLEVEAIYNKPLVAPVEAGQTVGKLKVQIPGQEPAEFDLVTASNVEELGFFAKMWAKVKISIGNLLKRD